MMKTFIIVLICSLFMMVLSEHMKDKPSPNDDIVCPDAASECPVTSTCCISKDGDYECCPIPNAVCCDDHIHCCPEHYKCDLKIFKCDRVFFTSKMLKHQPSSKIKQ